MQDPCHGNNPDQNRSRRIFVQSGVCNCVMNMHILHTIPFTALRLSGVLLLIKIQSVISPLLFISSRIEWSLIGITFL